MYLIYTRRSTDDADNQKNSLEYQEQECRRNAKQVGLQVATNSVEGFMEDGIIKERHSAFKSSAISVSGAGLVEYQIERPKFMQLISVLLSGQYEGVIVLCWDRISRNEQSDLIVKELLKKNGIRIHFVQADYDLTTSSGELHMDIDGMFARHHSRVTSEKVRLTFKKMRESGECTYFSNIGYLDQGANNKAFDPERAPIIRRMYEMVDTGEWTISQITKWAHSQGLTSKPRRRKRTKEEMLAGLEVEEKTSKPISESTVHFMLTNQFYVGKMQHRGAWLPGNHPPLIDEPLFWRVQERLSSRCVAMHYMDKMFFTYRGLFRCSCGRGYSPYMQKGHIYYSCKCHDDCKNRNRNLKEEVFVECVQSVLDQLYFTDDELEQIEEGAKRGLCRASTKRDRSIAELNKRRERVNKDLDYLKQHRISLLREGGMSLEEWAQDKDRLLKELTEVDTLLGVQTETEAEMLDFVVTFSELIKSASALYKQATSQEKRRLAHLIFSELVVTNGKLASYKAKPEFRILLNRHSVQYGSPDWIRTSNSLVNGKVTRQVYTKRMDSYKDVFQALESAKVRYIIVGGVAMNLLGCPRFTNDIDILLALNPHNLEAMKKAMIDLGYEQRIPLALDELGDEKKAVKFVKEKNLLAYTFFHPKEPLYSVDIIVGASIRFDEFKKNELHVDVWGMQLPVVSIDDLIGLKREANREKDALDIAFLLEYKGL